MMVPSIAIVVVNYRTPRLTLGCLHSLVAVCAKRCRVTVVDNRSNDGSAERIAMLLDREGWNDWVYVLSLPHNRGFSAGNNAGIRKALEANRAVHYVLLLNPDTLIKPGAIEALVEFMDRNPQVGIAGSSLEDEDARLQCSAHHFPSPAGELLGTARSNLLSRLLPRRVVSPSIACDAHPCDWVSGASMIIRREVFEQIGLLDEGYFLYFEEVDFCFRARRAGWEVWYVPQSKIVHLEGASTGIGAEHQRRAAYWYDSRRRFFLKAYGLGGLVLADALWAMGRLSWFLRRCLGLASPANDPRWFAWDLLVGDLRAIVRRSGASPNSNLA